VYFLSKKLLTYFCNASALAFANDPGVFLNSSVLLIPSPSSLSLFVTCDSDEVMVILVLSG